MEKKSQKPKFFKLQFIDRTISMESSLPNLFHSFAEVIHKFSNHGVNIFFFPKRCLSIEYIYD